MMSQTSKQELLAALRPHYHRAGRVEKGQILDQLIAATGYHRKYAIQVLNHPVQLSRKKRRPRRSTYDGSVRVALEQIWRTANCICGKRLVPVLPQYIEVLERCGELQLDDETRARLLQISPATVDRLLQRARARHKPHGLSTTKPGTLLKHTIPVRTFDQWDDAQPGFMEIDLVAHCGDTTRGEYLNSLNMVDVCTRWVELVPLINRSQATVTAAIATVQQRLPYRLCGLDSDNGSEFINANLKRFCEQAQITFTRSRPYRKNDQAFVEQKNWTAIRQMVGYDRYEGSAACAALAALYEPLNCYLNFFQPVMVLVEKHRNGARVSKRYDQAKTPYQRTLDAPQVPDQVKAFLRHCYQSLNPAELLRQIEARQHTLWKLAIRSPAATMPFMAAGEHGGEPRFPAPFLPEPETSARTANEK